MGAANAVATALPVYTTPSALGTDSPGTRRITVAVASDQKPPMTIPRSARAIINVIKFGAIAITTSESSMSVVMAISTWRRSKRDATVAIKRLATTANRPEIEMAWPAAPSVA